MIFNCGRLGFGGKGGGRGGGLRGELSDYQHTPRLTGIHSFYKNLFVRTLRLKMPKL